MLPLATVEARIREVVPAGALEFELHDGPEVQVVLDYLNAEPLATDFAADSMPIAYWLGRPGAVVVPVLDRCVAGQFTLPAIRARALFGESL